MRIKIKRKSTIALVVALTLMSNIQARYTIEFKGAVVASEGTYATYKPENVKKVTLLNEESYLEQTVKLKTALNESIQTAFFDGKLESNGIEIKDLANNLVIQDKNAIVGNNLFKKDNMKFSVEKGERFELKIKNLNKSQCQAIAEEFSKDKNTTYVIVNNRMSENLLCEASNMIKLGTPREFMKEYL